MLSVYAALPLTETDLKQKLLQNTEDESYTRGDHKECNAQINDSKSSSIFGCWGQRFLTSCQFFNGFWVGFIIQTVSLGSTAIIAIYYGASEEDSQDPYIFKEFGFFYIIFFLLSQSWWFLFPVICISIDSGFAKSQGQATLAKYFCRSTPTNSDSVSYQSHREIFLGCVRFHIGIVFGCFIVWSMIDLYFGASLGVFAALGSSLLACLGLCYSMILIYDRFINCEEEQQTMFEEI